MIIITIIVIVIMILIIIIIIIIITVIINNYSTNARYLLLPFIHSPSLQMILVKV